MQIAIACWVNRALVQNMDTRSVCGKSEVTTHMVTRTWTAGVKRRFCQDLALGLGTLPYLPPKYVPSRRRVEPWRWLWLGRSGSVLDVSGNCAACNDLLLLMFHPSASIGTDEFRLHHGTGGSMGPRQSPCLVAGSWNLGLP